MHRVQENMLVSFHFKMYAPDGTLIGDTENDPMRYIHGIMSTDPPELADFLAGKEQGYQGHVIIEKAFGEALPPEESVQSIPLEELGGIDVQKEMMLVADVNGKELLLTVMDIQGDQAIVLMGHPLAGYDISFDVAIEEVRPSTPEDLETLKNLYDQ